MRLKVAILIFIIMLSYNHLKAQEYYFAWGKHYDTSLDTQHYYFPLLLSYHNELPDTAAVIRRSVYLTAMNEPVLFTDRSDQETFRFTWLRSADHPIVLRLVRDGNHCTLYWKESDGTGSSNAGKVIVDKQTAIKQATWSKFRYMLLKVNTCLVDTSGNPPPGVHSEWILEGHKGGYYQADAVYSPGPANEFYKACNYLLGFTDLVIEPGRKY